MINYLDESWRIYLIVDSNSLAEKVSYTEDGRCNELEQ